ncbi:MAG: endolytic transglycosylase MltG [Actinomycetaceae bacterium]|nr:endolytic transglycosylase MltG [Actinomycetaceae bacterium]
MSEHFPGSGSNEEEQGRASSFPTRREIMRERRLREAEEARKEQRRIARQQRREAEASGHAAQTGAPESRQRPPERRRPRQDENRRRAAGGAGSRQAVRTETHDPLTTGTRSRRVEVERARVRKRRRNAKIRTGIIITAVIVIILACVYIAWNAISSSRQTEALPEDYPGPGHGVVEFVVNPGDSGDIIGKNLVSENVIKSEGAFLQAWNDNAAANSLQPGTYTLMQEMRAVDALAALLDPANRSSNAITVPPGFTKAQVVERLSNFGEFKSEEVQAAMDDAQALGLPAEAGGDAEGWLAPGTYEVHADDGPADVLNRMVTATITKLDELGVPEGQRQDLLTKASILEREVNIDQYYPKVARVIENRLTKPEAETVGFLNMDSTVLYGVGKVGGVPTAAELNDESNPYNTYKHKGLPPGPISSPSDLALESMMNPEPGDWLYFVTIDLDTGETKFAATLAEQEQNRQEFNQWCSDNPGKC